MGRWTQFDEDYYRTSGLRRIAYDADTQTYTFIDSKGRQYRGVPGTEYEIAGRVTEKDVATERPGAFSDPNIAEQSPTAQNAFTFQDFLPPSALTAPEPCSPPSTTTASSASRFLGARCLPTISGMVNGLRRSSPLPEDKRALLRSNNNISPSPYGAASWNEKKIDPPHSHRVKTTPASSLDAEKRPVHRKPPPNFEEADLEGPWTGTEALCNSPNSIHEGERVPRRRSRTSSQHGRRSQVGVSPQPVPQLSK